MTCDRSAPDESPTAGTSGSTPVYFMDVWNDVPMTVFMAPRGETYVWASGEPPDRYRHWCG